MKGFHLFKGQFYSAIQRKRLNIKIHFKISENLKNGVQKTDFEELKSDIASMLSSVQGNFIVPEYNINKNSHITPQDIETLNKFMNRNKAD